MLLFCLAVLPWLRAYSGILSGLALLAGFFWYHVFTTRVIGKLSEITRMDELPLNVTQREKLSVVKRHSMTSSIRAALIVAFITTSIGTAVGLTMSASGVDSGTAFMLALMTIFLLTLIASSIMMVLGFALAWWRSRHAWLIGAGAMLGVFGFMLLLYFVLLPSP